MYVLRRCCIGSFSLMKAQQPVEIFASRFVRGDVVIGVGDDFAAHASDLQAASAGTEMARELFAPGIGVAVNEANPRAAIRKARQHLADTRGLRLHAETSRYDGPNAIADP